MAKRRAGRRATGKKTGAGAKAAIAAVVVAIIVVVVVIRTSGPWLELRAKYPGPADGYYRYASHTVELRSAGRIGAAVHRDAIAIDWGESALSLGMRRPMGWFFRPLRIPTEAIASCEKRDMSGAWTGVELWLADLGIGVGFPRYDEQKVLAWCRERGIRISEARSAAR